LINSIRQLIRIFGFDIVKYYSPNSKPNFPVDFDQAVIDTILSVNPFTLTSPERIFALCEAIKYIVTSKISGDVVECGVWKGGSMMAVARTLAQLNDSTRHLYLFDTFDGMTPPSAKDISLSGTHASTMLETNKKEDETSVWCYSPLEEVKEAVTSVGYSTEKIHFIKGRVEDTLPAEAPQKISLLRLDTDWYESTRHELIHLFPRLSPGGVIIIDDYGHWKGARQAVDEYIQENSIKILLNRIDYTGRIGVKSSFS